MKGSKDILSSALKTAQMGQVGIRSVMHFPLSLEMQQALKSQLYEYDGIEQEVQDLAYTRGWTLEELDPTLKTMAKMASHMRLSYGNTNSKAAAMTIQGNTRGLIKGYKNLNQYNRSDPKVTALAEKLLTYEKENIRQMQGFV